MTIKLFIDTFAGYPLPASDTVDIERLTAGGVCMERRKDQAEPEKLVEKNRGVQRHCLHAAAAKFSWGYK
jgi:hypothetical protein